MFKETNYKVSKKLLKQVKSDLDAVIGFEKSMQQIFKDKRLHPEIKAKLTKSLSLMEGAQNNTKRIRREILELIRDKTKIIKE